MSEGHVLDIGRPVADFLFQFAALLFERLGVRIEVDVDESAERFDLNRIKADVLDIEVDEVFAVGRSRKASVETIEPRVVGTEDSRYFAFAPEKFVGPVFADIVESAEIVLPVAQDCNRMSGDSGGDIRAWLP